MQAFNLKAMCKAESLYGQRKDLQLTKTQESALISVDVLMIITEWQEFRVPNFDKIADILKYPVIFDGRNLYNPNTVAAHGIDYFPIGRELPKFHN